MQALQDHDTVTNVIDAVIAGTGKCSEVTGMKRERERERRHGGDTDTAVARIVCAPATGNARSPSEDRRGRNHNVGNRPNAVSGENESRKRARSPPRNIQGRDHED